MLGWFQFGKHYIATVIDIFQLRPRRFLLFKEETPSRYMPPVQFGVASLSLIFLLNLAAYPVTDYRTAVLGMGLFNRDAVDNFLFLFSGVEALADPWTSKVYADFGHAVLHDSNNISRCGSRYSDRTLVRL